MEITNFKSLCKLKFSFSTTAYLASAVPIRHLSKKIGY
jgi:hypothetical protein